jgi:serine/threonine protein phosphatase PrpC
VLLAAVFDGHGAHGHLVSQFVRGVFERFANSLALLPESELAEGFTKVFNLAQESLEREGLAEMAGTTATVALINANSGVLTVAHVGDSTLAVFVGKAVSFKTKDHVVDAEAERYVRARGGDVRSLTFDGVTAKRIYHKGEDSAGLGMSRALGHTELQPLIPSTPEVVSAQFSPGSTLVIASDGIWEKIPPEALAEIIATQPPTMTSAQAGGLAKTLVAEARRRWHGDIDDITAVAVRAVPDMGGGSLTAAVNS